MLINFFCLLIFFFYTSKSCVSQSTEKPFNNDEPLFVSRVVRGNPASIGDVPYQVAFKTQFSRSHVYATVCGGVIISHIKVVSAAHCFDKYHALISEDKVTVESQDLGKVVAVAGNLYNYVNLKQNIDRGTYGTAGQWRRLLSATYPSTYKFPKDDIAVIMTTRRFFFNMYVAPIAIASVFIDYKGECLVSGYGRTSLVHKSLSDRLLIAELPLIPVLLCTRMYGKSMRKNVCTSGQFSDVAQGDSGGPLVCRNTSDPNEGRNGILVGITSAHRKRLGSLFTRVSMFYTFIMKIGAENAEEPNSCPLNLKPTHSYILKYIMFFDIICFS